MLLTEDEIEERVNRMEVQNLAYYGYGISSFILSLIETAIELTSGASRASILASSSRWQARCLPKI